MNNKYRVIAAIFDIKPVNENGEINLEKLSSVEPVLNLGRKLRISKTGIAVLKNQKPAKSTKNPALGGVLEDFSIALETGLGINLSLSDPRIKSSGNVDKSFVEPVKGFAPSKSGLPSPISRYATGSRKFYQKRIKKQNPDRSRNFEGARSGKSPGGQFTLPSTSQQDADGSIISQMERYLNEDIDPKVELAAIGVEVIEKVNFKEPVQRPKGVEFRKISLPKVSLPVLSFKKLVVGGMAAMLFGFFTNYGFLIKNEIVLNGNSAVANLESAGENIKNLDFDAASTNFSQAYSDFAEAGNDLNFMGSAMTSLIGDLPGGGKIKSAKKLVEAGKLMADAGQAMSQAMAELAKTGAIFNPAGSNVSVGGISKDLKQALVLSKKNVEKAKDLLEDVEPDSLPEDKRQSFEEFKAKLPEFEELISDAADYSKFMEEFIGTSGTKQYLLLFQNPAELRPTGGFPGSYGIISFKDGKLQDFRVDDVYNLDGQLKELYVPPVQLQHIVPNWAMRDANWFVDFPASAGKIAEFYKKESGQDVDGVITFSPTIVSNILKVTGPIQMEKYGVTLNAENFSELIQEEVEYKGDRNQPKKILVDLAPLMLEKMYSADSEKWMEIFNILVSSVDKKDILMYFRDLKLQDFSVTKGFSGKVNQTGGDYLMATFTNVKGSKTDSVIDSNLKADLIFEGDDVRHRLVITRDHNGGNSKYGFFNKQSPTYVRVLVPENATFLGISGNSKPNYRPLLDYKNTDFKRDEDLVRFEEKSNYDSETGVTIYEEAGKREYGFWMLLKPGETKSVELEYRVPGKAAGGEYEFYVQKQPGLESGLEVVLNGEEVFNGRLEKDVQFKFK